MPEPQHYDLSDTSKSFESLADTPEKVLQMQFYSMINFHCVLNELNTGLPEPVSNQLDAADEAALQMAHHVDPSEFDDIEELGDGGWQSGGVRIGGGARRPSRGQ